MAIVIKNIFSTIILFNFHSSIMDEDEWTDRNFGGNSLVIEEDNNTSEDSVSDLDSDEFEEDSKKPLSAKEARQLQREWLKRIRNGDEDVSQYDNVKDHR